MASNPADQQQSLSAEGKGVEGGVEAGEGQRASLKGNKDGAKVTLYWLEKSRAQRILWLLEELQITYDLKTFKRQQMLAPPELKKIHPLGKSPILTISSPSAGPDDKPIVLAESSFIIEYLIEHFGPWLMPTKWKTGMEGKVGGETENWLRYRYFMHYAEGTLMPYLVIAIIMGAIKTNSPFLIKPLTGLITGAVDSKFLTPNLAANFAFLESQLASSPADTTSTNKDSGSFLCGPHLTGADIVMSFPLSAAAGGGRTSALTKEKYPLLWAYIQRFQELQGYKKAVEKIVAVDGSYDASL